jgi:hypothetical protein
MISVIGQQPLSSRTVNNKMPEIQPSSALHRWLLATDLFNNDCIVLHGEINGNNWKEYGKKWLWTNLMYWSDFLWRIWGKNTHKNHNKLTSDLKVL